LASGLPRLKRLLKGKSMRIQPEEQAAIITTITGFDRESEIYLFGSRLDDAKRGGDIDILIKSDLINRSMLAHIEDKLFRVIDEQKIDFVLTHKNAPNSFSKMILAKGAIQLW
jgi:predicted nucleotidyltransferase